MARLKDLTKRLKIREVVQDLREFWPVTLRHIFYQLVVKEVIENCRAAYQGLSKLLTELRHDGFVQWDSMEDRTRHTSEKRGYTDLQEFVKRETDNFLTGYARCRIQGQSKHIEIFIEKDTLSKIFENVAWPFCIRVTACKGYGSTSQLKQYSTRSKAAIAQGQTPVVHYYGDFDPSGWDMLNSLQKRLREDFKVEGIIWKRIALTPEIIEEYQLPTNPDALKHTDSRAKKFMELYGNLSVELEALHPRELKNLIHSSLFEELDWEIFDHQQQIEKVEHEKVQDIRTKIMAIIQTELEA